MAADFGKWWNDTKKHRKRLSYWMPHAKAIATQLLNGRPMRYFTLCARSMIDVFMFLREGLLRYEPDSYAIGTVHFCEMDAEQFAETLELVGREDSGFLGRLEDIVLFQDDDFTAQFPTVESISVKLEDEGFQAQPNLVDLLQLKRSHFHVKASFPYDYINLDFCEYYYPHPPGVIRINETIGRILDWQRETSQDESHISVDQFILTVTCRHDADFPAEAEARLVQLVRDNCAKSSAYREEVERTRRVTQVEKWLEQNREDFFFAGWPKDIARNAIEYGWAMEILDYVYYRRIGDEGNPYIITCIVARFSRAKRSTGYLPAALHALRSENRKQIPDIDRDSPEGRLLLKDLGKIVEIRNEQALRVSRPLLPAP